MIISHSKQVNFWKIPRTGSTTVELLLRLTAGLDYSQDVVASGHFFPDQHHNIPGTVPNASPSGLPGYTRTHLTPTEAISFGVLTQAQYDSYQNFCMVRDPLDKMISAHSLGFRRDTFDVAEILRNRVRGNENFAIFKPQVEWLAEGNMTPLPFSDYENSVRTVLTAFGAPIPVDIPNITRRHPEYESFVRSIATAADRAAIEDASSPYARDARLNY
jgi:hypothetical protein